MTYPIDERGIFQRVVLGLHTPQHLGRTMVSGPPSASVSRRWGTVDAITGDTLTVNVGGVVVPGVRRVANYAPTVGETVMLDVVQGDLVVVNTLAPSPKNDVGRVSADLDTAEAAITGLDNRLDQLEIKKMKLNVLWGYGRYENRAAGSRTTAGTITLPDVGYSYMVEVSGQAECLTTSVATTARYELLVADTAAGVANNAGCQASVVNPGNTNWTHGNLEAFFAGPYTGARTFSFGATCNVTYHVTDYSSFIKFWQIPV